MLNVGIIGAGYFGHVHARAIARHPAARVAAVCSRNPGDAAALAASHGAKVGDDWRALLADPKIDAVLIATPHHLHAEMAIAALAAGKHVLLEKPMAPTLAECRRIEAAADQSPGLLSIGHVMHYFRPLLAVRQLVDGGRYGRPVSATSRLVKLWMEANRQPWHLDRATGGGMLMTAGIHAVDQLVWLMGGRVAAVSALAGTFFHDQPVDDIAFVGLRLADGRIAQLASIGYRDGAMSSTLDIVCEDAIIAVDIQRGSARVGRGAAWQEVPLPDEEDGMDGALFRQWSAFVDAVAGRDQPPVPAAYGRHIVAIVEAALEAAEQHREIAVGG